MYNPKITIVIPVYNGSNYLQEAIESAINQRYQNKEIVVVNDGSCDGGKTQAIIDSYSGRIRGFSKENGGVATALNLALREMTGDYFAWLSHDDLLKIDALEIYVRELQEIDKTTILYGNYDLIDEESRIYNWVDFSKRFSKEELEKSVYPVISGCVNACACLVHRSHFDRVGMFDENLKITQDNEMMYRIFRNQKIHYIKKFLCSKRYHATQDSATKDIYPDEDRFIYESMAKLTVEECCEFKGSVVAFFLMMKSRLVKGKHILSEKYCNTMIEKAKANEIYEGYSKEKLIKLLIQSNIEYEELYERYCKATAKNVENIMGR